MTLGACFIRWTSGPAPGHRVAVLRACGHAVDRRGSHQLRNLPRFTLRGDSRSSLSAPSRRRRAKAPEPHRRARLFVSDLVRPPARRSAAGRRACASRGGSAGDGRAGVVPRAGLATRPASGKSSASAPTSDLEAALQSIDRDELPLLRSTPKTGKPPTELSSSLDPGTDPGSPITFTQHVAPILRKNCVSCHRPGRGRSRSRC